MYYLHLFQDVVVGGAMLLATIAAVTLGIELERLTRPQAGDRR